MKNTSYFFLLGVLILFFSFSSFRGKEKVYRGGVYRKSFQSFLFLEKDSFKFKHRTKHHTTFIDRGIYVKRHDTLFFNSLFDAPDTTFSRYLKLAFSENYSSQPDSSMLILANKTGTDMKHIVIKRGTVLLWQQEVLAKHDKLVFHFPCEENKDVTISYDKLERSFSPKEVMVFENHCDTLYIRGPMLYYGIKKKDTITLNPIELLANKIIEVEK